MHGKWILKVGHRLYMSNGIVNPEPNKNEYLTDFKKNEEVAQFDRIYAFY